MNMIACSCSYDIIGQMLGEVSLGAGHVFCLQIPRSLRPFVPPAAWPACLTRMSECCWTAGSMTSSGAPASLAELTGETDVIISWRRWHPASHPAHRRQASHPGGQHGQVGLLETDEVIAGGADRIRRKDYVLEQRIMLSCRINGRRAAGDERGCFRRALIRPASWWTSSLIFDLLHPR